MPLKPTDRIWLVSQVILWTCLIVSWNTRDYAVRTVLIGIALLIGLVFTVERYENWKSTRIR